MSLTTYSGLVESIGAWLDRDDLAARAPDFIVLAEARLNRLLADPDMAVTATITASGEYTTLPADFGEMVSITTGDGPLGAIGPVEFAGLDKTMAGPPRSYSLVARQIAFWPANTTAAITMVYRRTVPALTALNTSNWLLVRAPDAYLYGTLVQAEAYLAEDDRLPLWKSAFDEAIAELQIDAERRRWGAGPIAPRVRRA